MAESKRYELIVIGDGQGGDPLARAFAKAGRSVALIERGDIGGTCINTGCTPSKTLAASARIAYLARRSADYGVHAGPVRVDMAEVVARKRHVVEDFRGSTEKHLQSIDNLDLIRGEASFTGQKSILVETAGESRELTAELVVVDTGARPAIPPIDGLDKVPFLDSTSVMELETLPDHLLVLGGGYNALELGQMFRRFGSEVTIVEAAKQLLGHEDEDVAKAVADILRQDGIEIHLEAKAVKAERPRDNIELVLQGVGGARTISGSHLLVAVGRSPNAGRLNLAAAGIKTDEHGYIQVNEKLATSVEGVYAIGDVTGGPAFTHISYDDFRILRANLLEGGNRTTHGRLVPYTVFIDPQLGRVGLTEQEARAKGLDIQVACLQMSDVARAVETSETRGFMKAIVDRESRQILGCAVLGMDGGELMAVLEVAMMSKMPYTALRDGVFAHPTLAESLNNLFMTLDR
ncbi:MAG TPA: mercuric reductase [Capsulimonadaceae bacterium]|nr:mercuric reductase [Capsulimonadaceae bacterium]